MSDHNGLFHRYPGAMTYICVMLALILVITGLDLIKDW